MSALDPMSNDQAQAIHNMAMALGDPHDPSMCWCCCETCDTEAMWAAVLQWDQGHEGHGDDQ